MMKPNNDDNTLRKALQEHKVSAKVADCDHYRIRGGLAVETDYIVKVKPTNDSKLFDAFTISKTYNAFRSFAHQLRQVSTLLQKHARASDSESQSHQKLIMYCDLVYQLIDAQRTAYLGKVNYMYVKVLAKQRKQIIDDVLAATCSYFPSELQSNNKDDELAHQLACIIETFFLTDHVVEDRDANASSARSVDSKQTAEPLQILDNINPLTWLSGGGASRSSFGKTAAVAATRNTPSSVVIPMTLRDRRAPLLRQSEEDELNQIAGDEAKLLVEDHSRNMEHVALPSYSQPVPTVRSTSQLGMWFENNPWVFVLIAVVSILFLQKSAHSVISVDGDVFLLVLFASFCIGLHTPRPMVGGFDKPDKFVVREDRSGRKLLRRSMLSPRGNNMRSSMKLLNMMSPSAESSFRNTVGATAPILECDEEISDDEMDIAMSSPMAMFPEGAEIGAHLNCWSRPDVADFFVRGPQYLSDKKKVPSGDYLFPCRGLDLFLTDTCPQNVGRNKGVMGGRLREVPTFIINFRLPWGVLLLYAEIPEKFVKYVKAMNNEKERETLAGNLAELTPPERTLARWLLADDETKNELLKIVPVVVDGPWVVKSVVGGKPAIIGAKLPINYVYNPAQGNDALYLEADLDIAASSAARGILSVTRSYTQILTMNLGFVVQGNHADELPEQMLTGARLHGLDPLTAPAFPEMDEELGSLLAPSPSDDLSV